MDRDNGYHSDSEMPEADSSTLQSNEGQDRLLHDLNYDGDTVLYEPRYEEVKANRFERNLTAMKSLNLRITNGLFTDVESLPVSAEEYGAIILQKYVRGFLARKKYVKLLLDQFEKDEEIRKEKIKEQIDEAQLLIDNHHLEVQFEEYNVAKRNKAKRMLCYVITIQRAWRKYKSKMDSTSELSNTQPTE